LERLCRAEQEGHVTEKARDAAIAEQFQSTGKLN
jgi:hypothetical protein